jgi:hypothetical protein
VASSVGIGQRAARDAAADAQVIKATPQSPQAGLDVAQALAIGQLRERHAEKLVPARKTADLVVALITIHTAAEFARRNEIHQLREHRFAQMHVPPPPEIPGKDDQSRIQNSNRKRYALPANS